MRIKTKLYTGIGSLFLIILFFSGLSYFYIHKLSNDTKNILVDNYNSVEYGKQMLMSLNEDMKDSSAIKTFEINLIKQKENITEIGENKATETLIKDYQNLKQENYSNPQTISKIRKDLLNIIQLNMEAIQHKSNIAKVTADNALLWVITGSIICLFIAFVLLAFLPRNILEPIYDFIKNIQQIAKRNYSDRISLNRDDEFMEMADSFNIMAEKLQEYYNSNLSKILSEKNRMEALINTIQDPVIVIDENMKILFMNNEAFKISNLKKYDTIGKKAQDIAVKNDLIRALIQDFYTTSNENTPIKIYAEEKESYFQKQIIPITIFQKPGQEPLKIGHLIFLKNVTTFKELDFAKTNFIATISHELKTPLSSIRMSTQLLQNDKVGKLNTEQYELTVSIQEDIKRLLDIIGEILNMSQIETGNIQLSIIPSNTEEILDYAINSTHTQAEQKNIKIEKQIFCDSPILADREKTAWVLTNLITNAIRYSYDNSTIYLIVTQENNHINIAVKDTGQGIPKEYQSKIFNKYFKVPGTSNSGTGLGLAISKEFIEVQGGKISLESELGAGSIFTITMNMAI